MRTEMVHQSVIAHLHVESGIDSVRQKQKDDLGAQKSEGALRYDARSRRTNTLIHGLSLQVMLSENTPHDEIVEAYFL